MGDPETLTPDDPPAEPDPADDAPPEDSSEVSTIHPEPVRTGELTVVDFFAGAVDANAATLGDGPPAASKRRVAPKVPGFEVLGELGRGGMGVVYLARRTLLNRLCALKMILAGEHAGAESAVRFLAEAEAVARLQHPNVVQIHSDRRARGLPVSRAGIRRGRQPRSSGSTARPGRRARAAELVEALARAWPTRTGWGSSTAT